MTLLQAALTLPGIAGIVLTVGMAVDANVLIFERMREELAAGVAPQAAITAGYDKAFSSIADANITTLIAGIVLFAFGTGPVKGFAVTLSLGIVTSMFTAIVGTRAIVNWLYGGRRLATLPV
jgi:preprotein translocase subunit SecD